ncbi:CaiB/BaiF CoA transferase family protein [Peristeroidobacter agariperforans]|uniref:CaiB/BaiF CoA transferase family protein n=1 Tax=Peristeroidobacter agariperforans TaxID=268404 RepID=UPI00101DD20B|nr:CoA transferase [Peristeroidobacter agariperforans]
MSRPAPLSGLKVIELTHMVMGPAAGAMLAALGAHVIRVEPLEGDKTRTLLGSGAGYFPMYNRHKQSIALDLKAEDDLALAKRLATSSDILVENFRPGALDKIGLGYEALSASNPRLIYCSAKGFLPGPYEDRTALDEVAQMMGGLAYMTGPPGRPLRAGASVIDVTGGMFGVIGVLAALEERHRTGKGKLIQASLFETTVYLVGQHMAQFAVTGKPANPMPARISAWAIYDVFETKDEPIFIGVVTDALWEKFCKLFGLNELWADESLRKNNARVQQRDRILPQIRALIAGFTRAEIIQRLEGTGLPFAPIGKPEDMLDDPHLLASGALESVQLGDGKTTRLPTLPIAFDGELVAREASLSQIDEDREAILRDYLGS